MRSLWIALFLLFTALCVFGQVEKDPILFPVQGGNTTRYINNSGEVILTVPYSAGPFVEGLARIWVNGKTGYIDQTGNVVIEPQLVSSLDFSQGLAVFHVTSDCGRAENKNYYGFIDRQGKIVIAATLYRPCNYWGDQFDFKPEGLALTQVGERWGFIDKTGKVVMQFDDARHFSEGLAPAKIDGKFGFVDPSGRTVIPPQFESALPFSEGLALVRLNGKFGFIDRVGKIVIAPQFENAWSYSDGMTGVKIGEKWGYLDRTGHIVVQPGNEYTNLNPFSNGRAAVQVDREEGYIDKTGKLVIEARFGRTALFRDGLAQVLDAETARWEVIDINGKVVYRPPEPKQPPPNLNNPFVKVSLSEDVKWLESVASGARLGADLNLNGGLASHTKDLSTAAYARLGALGTPESLAAIKRIEEAVRLPQTITPKFVPLGLSAHPGWHFSDSQLTPIAQVKSADGITYGVLWEGVMGDLDLFLISSKTPEDRNTWTRPKLIPNRFYRGLREPKLTINGKDKLTFSFTQNPPPPRALMEGTHDPGPTAPVLGAQQVELSIKNIEKDSDGDGWTDIEEERLGVDVQSKDSDRDGIPDGNDVCPNAPIQTNPNDEDYQILQRALFAVFGLSGSRYLLLVDSGTKQINIPGYGGPIIYGENVESWLAKNRSGGVFVSWRIRKKGADAAIVEIVDYEGPLAAGGQDVRLRKIGDEWFVISRRTTWVS
jgi:hypothetical protein